MPKTKAPGIMLYHEDLEALSVRELFPNGLDAS